MMQVHQGISLALLLPSYLSFVKAISMEEPLSAVSVSAVSESSVSLGSIQSSRRINNASFTFPSLSASHASDHPSSGTNAANHGSSVIHRSNVQSVASPASPFPFEASTSSSGKVSSSPTKYVTSASEPSMINGARATATPHSTSTLPITPTRSAAIAQISHFGDAVLGFATDGRAWASDITLPEVKTQAVHQIEDMLGNSKNMIESLGGNFPPSLGPCSGAGYVHFRCKIFYHTPN